MRRAARRCIRSSRSAGKRAFPFARELWIEREDFEEVPPKGFFRLFPGNKVRLKYGYVIECTGCDKDADGNVIAVHCNYFPDTQERHAGRRHVKVKGNIHWVSAAHALHGRSAPVRPPVHASRSRTRAARDFLEALNPDSKTRGERVSRAGARDALPDERFQFERHGYFVADRVDLAAGQAGVQPHRHPARQLGQAGVSWRSCSARRI